MRPIVQHLEVGDLRGGWVPRRIEPRGDPWHALEIRAIGVHLPERAAADEHHARRGDPPGPGDPALDLVSDAVERETPFG